METLTALDATFLELEEADEAAHMHIGAVMILRPPAGDGPPGLEAVRRAIAGRLPMLPLYSRRLSTPQTGGLHWPEWELDPDFDIARHVRKARLPAPAGEEELREWAAEYFSVRLDRRHPLWELVLLELDDGRWALVSKTHHCLVDGVGSVDAAKALLDSEPHPAPPSPPAAAAAKPKPREAAPEKPGRGLLRRLPTAPLTGGARLLRAGAAGLELGARTVDRTLDPHAVRSALRQSRAAADLIVRDEINGAPRTSINVPIGASRSLAVVPLELDHLRLVRSELGGTVNDVVLAAVSGGLRRLLLERGETPPEQGLRAMVPVNIRPAAERLALGNKITSLFVGLPVGVEDRLVRYRAQVDEAEGLKASNQAHGSRGLIDIAALAPPVLHSVLARSLFATRLFNVTVTNVPGPPTPLYALGSEVEEIWPIVPLATDHAIGIAALSYRERLFICLNVDRDSVPDIDLLAQAIADEVTDLVAISAGPVAARVTV